MEKVIKSERKKPRKKSEQETIKAVKPTLPQSPLSEMKELEIKLKKLSYLALHLDPYAAETGDQTIINLIEEFELQTQLENPFHFTNKLLYLIDQTENRLKSLIQ
ncbi:MAG: hypothetical protein ACOYL6_00215 [Bacteriovoracaceae bacterium]